MADQNVVVFIIIAREKSEHRSQVRIGQPRVEVQTRFSPQRTATAFLVTSQCHGNDVQIGRVTRSYKNKRKIYTKPPVLEYHIF